MSTFNIMQMKAFVLIKVRLVILKFKLKALEYNFNFYY